MHVSTVPSSLIFSLRLLMYIVTLGGTSVPVLTSAIEGAKMQGFDSFEGFAIPVQINDRKDYPKQCPQPEIVSIWAEFYWAEIEELIYLILLVHAQFRGPAS